MSGFFLISALIGTVFFLALIFNNPSRYHIATYLPDRMRYRFILWSSYSPIWLLMLGIAPLIIAFILIFCVASLVHPAGGFSANIGTVIRSPEFASVVYGLIFGVLLSLWLYRFYYLDSSKDDVDWRMKAQGVLLLFLFIAGSQEWFGTLLDRIAKFSFGGAEVELTAADRGSNSDQSPRLVVVPPPSGGLTTISPALGLTILSQVSQIMDRDNAYLRSEKLNEIDPNISLFLKKYFGDSAVCYQSIYNATGNIIFIKDQYASLVPDLRGAVLNMELGAKPGFNINGFHDTYLQFARKIYDTYIDVLQFDQQSEIDIVYQRDVQKISIGCADFFSTYAGFPVVESLNRRYILQGADQAASNFKANFEADLAKVLHIPRLPRSSSLYLRLVLASVEDVADDPEAALKDLDDSLRIVDGDKEMSIEEKKWFDIRMYSSMYFIAEEWIRRSSFVSSVVTDFNIFVVQNTIRKFSELSIYVEGLNSYYGKEENIDSDYEKLPTNSGDCKIKSEQRPAIKFNRPWLVAYAGYTYITFIAVILEKMGDSKEYLEDYSGLAHKYMSELNHVDLSCLSLIFDEPAAIERRSAMVYADIFRLNAKIIVADAKSVQLLSDNKNAGEANKRALRASNLGLEVIGPFYKTDKGLRNYKSDNQQEPNKSFLDKVQTSDAIDLHDRLSALQSSLKDATK